MDTVRNRLIPLEEIPANRRLVEELFAHQGITARARDHALNLLYPAKNWGLWISRLLLTLGVTLMLAGIVYFFAFNWAAIPSLVKLASVQLALAACIGGTLFYGLNRLTGKVLALCAALLTGIFLAVFGQVYQTGADAWTLFGVWAVLITPWALVTNFAPLWGLWLVIANIGLALFWEQAVPHARETEQLILPLLAVFNAGILILREVMESRLPWLQAKWTRVLPALLILFCAAIPCITQIMGWTRSPSGEAIGSVVGIAILGAFFYVYRYKKPDMQTLAATVLTVCVVLEFALFRLLDGTFLRHIGVADLLMQFLFTIGLFSGAVVWLRQITKQVEVRHG
jgi:uncharacterized membrane protein